MCLDFMLFMILCFTSNHIHCIVVWECVCVLYSEPLKFTECLLIMAGKEYRFNCIGEPSDKLKCSICLDVATDPKQHETCGKVFCEECLEKHGDKPCPSCREESPNFFKDTRAAQEIRDLRLRCNNFDSGCSWRGTAGTLDKHLTACEFEHISCKYQYVGCGVKMMRKDIIKHEEEDDKKHLHLALQNVAVPALSDSESLVVKMSNYSSLRKKKVIFHSEPFYTHPHGYKMRLEINVNGCGSGEGSHLSVYTQLLNGPFDKTLSWPFLGTVSVAILNQKNNCNHCYVRMKYIDNKYAQPGSGGGWGIHQFISHSELSEESSKTQFIENDTIYFKVSVEVAHHQPWLGCGKSVNLLSSGKTNIQPHVFIVDGYESKKCKNYVYSTPTFFASPESYRMYIEVYPNGDGSGKDTHVSIYAFIVEGPYDGSVPWPILGIIKFELLNQVADKDHYKTNLKITNEDELVVGKNLGFPLFIRHTDLTTTGNKQFLKDDALYFRVTVVVGDHKPWLTCTSFI